MLALNVIAWLLLIPCAFALGLWLAVGTRIIIMLRDRPTIRRGLEVVPDDDAGPPPLVSIIVPAHNEERVIDACARTLRKQDYESIEIIFVLDRCTDSTLDIIRRHAEADDRIVVIENDACPDDWAGKCHAAHLGAMRARGEHLLFTDADTAFDPQLVRAAMNLARAETLGLLSILSTLTFEHRWERIAQPVASMHLIRMFPMERVNRTARQRAFANGQFMLFERSWYDRIGGHGAVRMDLLEDIAFARVMQNAGGRGGIFLADGMLRCSMYSSLDAFRLGWKRIFIESCNRRPRRLRKNAVRVVMGGIVAPIAQVAALIVGAVLWTNGVPGVASALFALVGIGWVAQLAALIPIYSFSGAPARSVVLFPLGSWIVSQTMLEGATDLAQRRPIPWAGRQYVLESRDEG